MIAYRSWCFVLVLGVVLIVMAGTSACVPTDKSGFPSAVAATDLVTRTVPR